MCIRFPLALRPHTSTTIPMSSRRHKRQKKGLIHPKKSTYSTHSNVHEKVLPGASRLKATFGAELKEVPPSHSARSNGVERDA